MPSESCPVILRTDCDTENGIIVAAQCCLQVGGCDMFAGIEFCWNCGTSPSNQHNEGWWSLFRKGRTDWWINFFKDMSQSGMLHLRNELYMKFFGLA